MHEGEMTSGDSAPGSCFKNHIGLWSGSWRWWRPALPSSGTWKMKGSQQPKNTEPVECRVADWLINPNHFMNQYTPTDLVIISEHLGTESYIDCIWWCCFLSPVAVVPHVVQQQCLLSAKLQKWRKSGKGSEKCRSAWTWLENIWCWGY